MAIVTAPALSLRASGDLGSINYTRWRGSAVARSKYTPVQPNTSAQQVIQTNLSTVTNAWGSTLTEEQREMWRLAARDHKLINRLGEEYQPTGYLFFCKVNMLILALGKSSLTEPYKAHKPLPIKSISTSSSSTGYIRCNCVLLDYSLQDSTRGIQYFVAGPYDSGGRRPIDGEYRQVGVRWGGDAYWFGSSGYISGKYYWFKCRGVNQYGEHANFHVAQIQCT